MGHMLADDALRAQKMSVGWGGKQLRMKGTWYIDIAGKRRKKSMIFTGQQTEKLVSSFSGRKQKGAPDPRHVGEPKGHFGSAVLCQRF
jgi:hypothetical protein